MSTGNLGNPIVHEAPPDFKTNEFEQSKGADLMAEQETKAAERKSELETRIKTEHRERELIQIERIEAIDIGDVHGDLESFLKTLDRAGIIQPLRPDAYARLEQIITGVKQNEAAKLKGEPIPVNNVRVEQLSYFLQEQLALSPEYLQKLEAEGALDITSLGDLFNKDAFGKEIVQAIAILKNQHPKVKFGVALGNHDHRIVSALGTGGASAKEFRNLLADIVKYKNPAYGASMLGEDGPGFIGGLEAPDHAFLTEYFNSRTTTPEQEQKLASLMEAYRPKLQKSFEQGGMKEVLADMEIISFRNGVMRWHGDPSTRMADFLTDRAEALLPENPTEADYEAAMRAVVSEINTDYQTKAREALTTSTPEAWTSFHALFERSPNATRPAETQGLTPFILGTNVRGDQKLDRDGGEKLTKYGVRVINHGHISDPDIDNFYVREVGGVAVVNHDISLSNATRKAGEHRTVRTGNSFVDKRGFLIFQEQETDATTGQELRSQSVQILKGAKLGGPDRPSGTIEGRDSYGRILIRLSEGGIRSVDVASFEAEEELTGLAVKYELLPEVTMDASTDVLYDPPITSQDILRSRQTKAEIAARDLAKIGYEGEISGVYGGVFAETFTSKEAAQRAAEFKNAITARYITNTKDQVSVKNFDVYALPDGRFMISNVTPFRLDKEADQLLNQWLEDIPRPTAEQNSPEGQKAYAASLVGYMYRKTDSGNFRKPKERQRARAQGQHIQTPELFSEFYRSKTLNESQTSNELSKQDSFLLHTILQEAGIASRVRVGLFGKATSRGQADFSKSQFRHYLEINVGGQEFILDPLNPDTQQGNNPQSAEDNVYFVNQNNVWVKSSLSYAG